MLRQPSPVRAPTPLHFRIHFLGTSRTKCEKPSPITAPQKRRFVKIQRLATPVWTGLVAGAKHVCRRISTPVACHSKAWGRVSAPQDLGTTSSPIPMGLNKTISPARDAICAVRSTQRQSSTPKRCSYPEGITAISRRSAQRHLRDTPPLPSTTPDGLAARSRKPIAWVSERATSPPPRDANAQRADRVFAGAVRARTPMPFRRRPGRPTTCAAGQGRSMDCVALPGLLRLWGPSTGGSHRRQTRCLPSGHHPGTTRAVIVATFS